MKLNESFECTIVERELYEMARVKTADSGLPCVLFASTKTYVNGRHGPRIKVSNVPGTYSDFDNFVVTIAKPPVMVAGTPKFKESVVGDIIDWVALNYDSLLKYWEDKYESDVDFYTDLKKL